MGRRPGIEKAKVNPEHPVNPVEIEPLAEKTIEDVLLHFGDTKRVARRRYRDFAQKGIDQGTRPDGPAGRGIGQECRRRQKGSQQYQGNHQLFGGDRIKE